MNHSKYLSLQRLLRPVRKIFPLNFGPNVENTMETVYNDIEAARLIKTTDKGQVYLGLDSGNEYTLSGVCMRKDVNNGQTGTLYKAFRCLYFRSDNDPVPCPGCKDLGFRSIVDGERIPCNVCKPT